jgi:hypothetical protein
MHAQFSIVSLASALRHSDNDGLISVRKNIPFTLSLFPRAIMKQNPGIVYRIITQFVTEIEGGKINGVY